MERKDSLPFVVVLACAELMNAKDQRHAFPFVDFSLVENEEPSGARLDLLLLVFIDRCGIVPNVAAAFHFEPSRRVISEMLGKEIPRPEVRLHAAIR